MGFIIIVAKLGAQILLLLLIVFALYWVLRWLGRQYLRAYVSGWNDAEMFDAEALKWRKTEQYLSAERGGLVFAGVIGAVLLGVGLWQTANGSWVFGAAFLANLVAVLVACLVYFRMNPKSIEVRDEWLRINYVGRKKEFRLEELSEIEVLGSRNGLGVIAEFNATKLWVPAYFSGLPSLITLFRDLLDQAPEAEDAGAS